MIHLHFLPGLEGLGEGLLLKGLLAGSSQFSSFPELQVLLFAAVMSHNFLEFEEVVFFGGECGEVGVAQEGNKGRLELTVSIWVCYCDALLFPWIFVLHVQKQKSSNCLLVIQGRIVEYVINERRLHSENQQIYLKFIDYKNMGGNHSKISWQEEYDPVNSPTSNPLMLKHKDNSQRCELLSLPLQPQDKANLKERIQKRTSQARSRFLTPLLNWDLPSGQPLCSSKAQLQLMFGGISPTLEGQASYRQVAREMFSAEEIMYIIYRVAFGLKDIQNMDQEHCRVDLSTICITSDVYLKDCLLLDAEERLSGKKRSGVEIEGYPSPQKLRSYYDSLVSFEELRGDLFSLGMVALQLYYLDEVIKDLYVNPNPTFRNYTLDCDKLSSMVQGVADPRLRHTILLLTNFQSKKRVEIYQMLKNERVDARRLPMLNQSTMSPPKVREQLVPQAPRVVETRAPIYVERSIPASYGRADQVEGGRMVEQVQASKNQQVHFGRVEPSRLASYPPEDIDSYRRQQFHHYSTLNHQTPLAFSSPSVVKQIQVPVSYSGTTTFSRVNNPELSTVEARNPQVTFHKQESHYKSPTSSVFVPPIEKSFDTKTRVTTSNYMPQSRQGRETHLNGNIPSFQDVLARVRGQNQPLGTHFGAQNKSPINGLDQPKSYFKSYQSQYQPQNNAAATFTTPTIYSTADTKSNEQSLIPRSESIYHDELREEVKGNQTNRSPPSDEVASKEQTRGQQAKTEEKPLPKKEQVVAGEGIDGAISAVSAVPQIIYEQPPYRQEELIKESKGYRQYEGIAGSLRDLQGQESDPKITVAEPLQMEPSSPLKKQQLVFVQQTYDLGTKYQGYMQNGLRHGQGKFYYKEGSYYDGEWQKNKMHGYGVLYYPNGTVAYQGEWRQDQFDGKGIVYNDQQRLIQGTFDFTDFNQLDDEWVRYEGELKSDAKDGQGKLILTNGEEYEGQFLKDMVHGVGVFRSGSSEKKGMWQNGRLKKLL